MDKAADRLTVFFEDPFWVGVFEHVREGQLSACKVTFGAEPKDCEVYDYVLKNYNRLCFGPAVEAGEKAACCNPKRVRRRVREELQNAGTGTKAQQALKLRQEQMKTENKSAGRRRRETEKQRQFALKQQKRKSKHRGR